MMDYRYKYHMLILRKKNNTTFEQPIYSNDIMTLTDCKRKYNALYGKGYEIIDVFLIDYNKYYVDPILLKELYSY